MRIYAAVTIAGLMACAHEERTSIAIPGCDYRSLAKVAATPNHANGRMLCADLYSYSKHGFLAFYDMRVKNTSQALNKEALLIGEDDANALFKGKYPRDGQRVGIKGTINLQLSCFSQRENACVPIRRPIYISSSDLSVIKHAGN